MRYLWQRRDLRHQGLSLAPAFQQSLETQCQTREGGCQRHSLSRKRLHPLLAFRQSDPRNLTWADGKGQTDFGLAFFVVSILPCRPFPRPPFAAEGKGKGKGEDERKKEGRCRRVCRRRPSPLFCGCPLLPEPDLLALVLAGPAHEVFDPLAAVEAVIEHLEHLLDDRHLHPGL